MEIKEYNEDVLRKFRPREKISFNCPNCRKELTMLAQSILHRGSLLCSKCNGGNKRRDKKRYYEGDVIKEIPKLQDTVFLDRKLHIEYECEKCHTVHTDEQLTTLIQRKRLFCEKCNREQNSMLRYGVTSYLKIAQVEGVKKTHTPEGIAHTREGLLRNLWVENFDKRKKQFEKKGWNLINVDFDKMEIELESKCCHVKRTYKLGTDTPRLWRCDCKKHGYTSVAEVKFVKILKELYPQYEIVQTFVNWCKDPLVKVPSRYEIDCYFPELKLGIEFNGTYWHNKENQWKEELKTKRALESGIKLIHIWEDDWNNNKAECIENIKEIINDRIKNL
jgi:hypothetical protein